MRLGTATAPHTLIEAPEGAREDLSPVRASKVQDQVHCEARTRRRETSLTLEPGM